MILVNLSKPKNFVSISEDYTSRCHNWHKLTKMYGIIFGELIYWSKFEWVPIQFDHFMSLHCKERSNYFFYYDIMRTCMVYFCPILWVYASPKVPLSDISNYNFNIWDYFLLTTNFAPITVVSISRPGMGDRNMNDLLLWVISCLSAISYHHCAVSSDNV